MNIIARRNFFVSLAAMLAGVMLPSLRPVAGQALNRQLGILINALIPDCAAAGRLGRAYLTDQPAELDLQRLVEDVLGPLGLQSAADANDTASKAIMIARAKQAVTDDYIAGRVVDVDGWVLSITEARLYALAALADGNLR